MSRVAEAYDASAEVYDRVFVEHNRKPWQAVYLPRVRPGHDVLDVGCGTGIDSVACARVGARVVGIDASRGMLDVARERARASDVNVSFQLGNLEDGAVWGTDAFDRVISGFAAINTAGSPASFFRSAHRALRPGGEAMLHFLTPAGLFDRAANLSRGRFRTALGAWREHRREVSVGGTSVVHEMWRPDVLYRGYAEPLFSLVEIRAVGVVTPDDGPSRVPAPVVPLLRVLDARLGRAPGWRLHGRFAVLVLRRR